MLAGVGVYLVVGDGACPIFGIGSLAEDLDDSGLGSSESPDHISEFWWKLGKEGKCVLVGHL